MKRTEEQAHVSLIHAIAHYGQFPTPENHRVYADCIDAYAEAVRAERDTAWRAAIEGMRRDTDDEIIAAIDDPRHSKGERSGLRMARIIVDAALDVLADTAR